MQIGDATPGMALLYPDHPYNIAFSKVNEKFLGASQLVIIAEGTAYCTTGGKECEGAACVRCLPEETGKCAEGEQCLQGLTTICRPLPHAKQRTPDSAGRKLHYAETCAPHGPKSQYRAAGLGNRGIRECVKGVT